MTAEPSELTKARAHLGRFETEMNRPEGLAHLSKALSLLADIRADAESEKVRHIASNLSLSYATQVQVMVESLLSREPSVHWEIGERWEEIFSAFERSGFALPQNVAETRSKLSTKMIRRAIALMSTPERKELLERLTNTK
jgi:flagellin-specific chaperone FliS